MDVTSILPVRVWETDAVFKSLKASNTFHIRQRVESCGKPEHRPDLISLAKDSDLPSFGRDIPGRMVMAMEGTYHAILGATAINAYDEIGDGYDEGHGVGRDCNGEGRRDEDDEKL